MKKFMALILVFSLLYLSANVYAKERRGADLVITKKDSLQVRGELIAVKESSLVMKEKESGGDVNIYIGNIKTIKILRKSKAAYGFLIGGAIGAAVGYAQGDDQPTSHSIDVIQFNFFGKARHKAIVLGLALGALGATIGKIATRDETYLLEGSSPHLIEFALEKLRKKARISAYQ